MPENNNIVKKQDSDPLLFSFYKAPVNVTRKKPYKNVFLQDIYKLINSKYYQARIKKLRTLSEKDQQAFKKSNLDFVTFSGIFDYRAINGLLSRSCYLCIDLDHIGDHACIDRLKHCILDNFTPALLFISPRGEGLKVVICIKPDEGSHEEYFNAVEIYFNDIILLGFRDSFGEILRVDTSGKDISRATYLTHDPDCFYSESPTIFDRSYIDTFLSGTSASLISAPAYSINAIEPALKMIRNSLDGQKHITLLKASKLVGGMIAGGQITESEAIKLLEQEISEKDIKNFNQAQKSIQNGINYGKSQPIYPGQHKKEKDLPRVPLLPIEGLPEALQTLISICSQTYGTHRDFWAAAFLLATSLGIGQSLKLKTKYENAPCLWFTFIAPTSIGKTEPLKIALFPFFVIDKRNYADYKRQEKEYDKWKNTIKTEREVEYMEPPVCVQYVLQDFTPEALYKVHSENLRGVIIYRDELRGWINDFDRYNKSGEQENYLSAFMGNPFIVNRKNQSLRIDAPFVNVGGGLQPSLIPLFAKDGRDQNGFLARFGHVFPDDAEKPFYNNNVIPDHVLKDYSAYITNLLKLKYKPDTKEFIQLCPDAESMYQAWYNNNAMMTNNEHSDYLRGVYGKLDIISLRLALTIHFSKWALTGKAEKQVTSESMKAALDITEYFRATGIKFYNHLQTDETDQLTNKSVALFLHAKGNSQNDIAKVLKCSQQNIQKILKQ